MYAQLKVGGPVMGGPMVSLIRLAPSGSQLRYILPCTVTTETVSTIATNISNQFRQLFYNYSTGVEDEKAGVEDSSGTVGCCVDSGDTMERVGVSQSMIFVNCVSITLRYDEMLRTDTVSAEIPPTCLYKNHPPTH